MSITNYKVCLVGDTGVGKTSLVFRSINGTFRTQHIPTLGVEVHPIGTFSTTEGHIKFNVWDIAGDANYCGLRDMYLMQSRACIIMVTKNTLDDIDYWIDLCKLQAPNAPIVILINKIDLPGHDMTTICHTYQNELDKLRNAGHHIYPFSIKSNINIDKPWLDLARTLKNNQNLTFLDEVTSGLGDM